MGIFIGGPRDGDRVTGRDLMGGPVIVCPVPVSSFEPDTPIPLVHYRRHITKYGPHRTVFHYILEGIDQDEAEKRALRWHGARPFENDVGLERQARHESNNRVAG